MPLEGDSARCTGLNDALWRLAARTGIAEERLRRSFLVERLLARLLADAPDRWVRYDDWRLEYRYDGVASAHGNSEEVSEPARAAVDAALRRATEHQGFQPVQLEFRHCDRWPEVSQGPALAYRVEASDHYGEAGDTDLLVGFATRPRTRLNGPPASTFWRPRTGRRRCSQRARGWHRSQTTLGPTWASRAAFPAARTC